MVAADTFRAGATEQLKQWADRLNVPCITGKDNQDPSSVLVEGCRYAKANNIDYLICDTAGRLQNKVNLMAELEKMHRVIGKEIKGAPHNTWLVLDANTGQNGLSQAELAAVSGVALRQIQLFEQRQRDINCAAAITILKLSRSLHCRMEDLMEY